MIWKRLSNYHLVGDLGYKIARFKVSDNTLYRPSYQGSLFGNPFTNLDDAKQACDDHAASLRGVNNG